MQTIYISDLDGTLLNSNRVLSSFTIQKLNDLIKNGINFTIATARTPATVVPLFKDVNLKLPIIVMNGSFIYDIAKQEYISTSKINETDVKKIIEVVDSYNKQVLLYTLENHMLNVYYKNFNSIPEEIFYNDRKNLSLKKFIKVDSYEGLWHKQVGHIVMIDTFEVIIEIYEQIKNLKGIQSVMYKEANHHDSYILEIASIATSKGISINEMKQIGNCDQVVVFGDNKNDISMFHEADITCVVENGCDELKSIANNIIGINDEDSVVKFIEQHSQYVRELK